MKATQESRQYGPTIEVGKLPFAHRTRQEKYQRPITDEEKAVAVTEAFEIEGQIRVKAEELKKAGESLKAQIKLLKKRKKSIEDILVSNIVESSRPVYEFHDHDSCTVHTYHADGSEAAGSPRDMEPKERQTFIS